VVKRVHRLKKIFFLFLFVAGALPASHGSCLAGNPPEDPMLERVRKVLLRGLLPDEIISADQVRSLQAKKEKLTIFDSRSGDAYQFAHIEGAVLPISGEYYRQRKLFVQQFIPVSPDPDEYLIRALSQYPKDALFVTYCEAGCKASATLLLKIKAMGFANVRSMEEGFNAWQKKGYPVVLGAPSLSPDPFAPNKIQPITLATPAAGGTPEEPKKNEKPDKVNL